LRKQSDKAELWK